MIPKTRLPWLCAALFAVLLAEANAKHHHGGGHSKDHDDPWGHNDSHEEDDDDDHHRGRHHKGMIALTALAIVLLIAVIVLAACVCKLKKRLRNVSRVRNTALTITPVSSPAEKYKLPEGDISTGYPVGYSPYVIKTTPPPSYHVEPPRATPTSPPSYSTLSLKRAAQEHPEVA